jgi:hypothetical protein
MSVSSISSSTSSTDYLASLQTAAQQRFQNMKSLTDSVQSGDLTTAKSALAAVKQDVANAPKPPQDDTTDSTTDSTSSSTSSSSNPMSDALSTLETAIDNNDVSGAQSALASLAPHHQGGGQGMPPQDSTSSTDTTTTTTDSTGRVLNATA